MGFSLSDDYKIFRKVPRWVWIIILFVSVITRGWALVAVAGFGIIIYFFLWLISFISAFEVLDITGPGHKRKKKGFISWLWS